MGNLDRSSALSVLSVWARGPVSNVDPEGFLWMSSYAVVISKVPTDIART